MKKSHFLYWEIQPYFQEITCYLFYSDEKFNHKLQKWYVIWYFIWLNKRNFYNLKLCIYSFLPRQVWCSRTSSDKVNIFPLLILSGAGNVSRSGESAASALSQMHTTMASFSHFRRTEIRVCLNTTCPSLQRIYHLNLAQTTPQNNVESFSRAFGGIF